MKYEYWLASSVSLTDRKKRLLREEYGDARAVYYIEEIQLEFLNFLENKDVEAILRAKKAKDVDKEWERLIGQDIRFVPYFSKEYPGRLAQISDAPYALYVKGCLPKEENLSAAIVGARKCTPYGEQTALEYGELLAANGIQIISGMARGIDGAGQRGALNGRGTTYGVLGCGVDICYPREHIGLYMDIQAAGGVLSEQPPGSSPLPVYFPARNRIISGLADVVLVMEARERSGSLITADLALESGRDVFVVPGNVTSALSEGTNALIKQGCPIVTEGNDILFELGIAYQENEKEAFRKKAGASLSPEEEKVYGMIEDGTPVAAETICRKLHMNIQEIQYILSLLELSGLVRKVPQTGYVRES